MPLKAICRARQAPLPQDCPAKAIRSPAMLTKYSKIFRTIHSFVFVGKKDGRAPAMGLGSAKWPLEFEDLVWPRERVPRQLTLAIHATGD